MPLSYDVIALLALLILLAAALYSSVGHGGASAYLAAMALLGLAPAVMKPTALVLNILVASIATARFVRARCFDWNLFWPFAVASVPAAFLGGAWQIPGTAYKRIVGLVLVYSAIRLLLALRRDEAPALGRPPRGPSIALGAAIGLLSGLVGVGGGIFLSPLLLFCRWAAPRQTAGVSAAFILVNSVAGLLGHMASLASVPPAIVAWGPCAVVGGLIGAELGSRRLPGLAIRRLLGVVLLIAAVKLLLV